MTPTDPVVTPTRQPQIIIPIPHSAMQMVPLAIIGIGCLFPGAGEADTFWAHVKNGHDGIGPVPDTHWRVAEYYDPNPQTPDHTYAQRGGFLQPIDFHPLEFGISPNALEATDTAQLLGLVAAREALRNAGYDPGGGDFDRDNVSVILGVTGTLELVIPLGARLGHPLWRRALKEAGVDDDVAEDVVRRIGDGYVEWQENSFPGLLGNVVAGRIANRLNLRGTNCVVDAACASSLSAIHLAALELAAGRSHMVVTGGVDTFNDIFMYMCFSKTPALSPSGDARPFSSDGDGTILGEGLGMVVLKRLDDAQRDGDTIHAVLRGMGTSSDGSGNAVYAPSAEGQKKALRDAYATAGVTADTIELVEGHGTGTRVGDAVEATALAEVYREAQRTGRWCALGSVKSQIGHTKAAAGAAGLIKAVLALKHKVLPPTIKVSQPVDVLADDSSPIYLNTEKRPWLPREQHPRRAAVSSFGFGGSNFHCVLEEYIPEKTEIDWDGSVEIVALSGERPESLETQLAEWSTARAWETIQQRAFESRQRYDRHAPWRLTFVLTIDGKWDSTIKAGRALLQQARETSSEFHFASSPLGVYLGKGGGPGKLAFLFPGQGSQYVGMLRDLVCQFPAMLTALTEANHLIDDQRLSDVIYPIPVFTPEDRAKQELRLRATQLAQPALGAMSVGACNLLHEFGVTPDVVAGHSYGELVALHAAGCFDVRTLHELSRARGQLMAEQAAVDAGGMIAVQASREVIETLLREERSDVQIANHNSPKQLVLSGPSVGIHTIEQSLQRRGLTYTRIPVSTAFHSSLVANARQPFREVMDRQTWLPSRIPVFSNKTAGEYPENLEQMRDMLADQIANPVRFVEQIQQVYDSGARVFVEVGPSAVLTGLVRAILREHKRTDLATLDASKGTGSGVEDLAQGLARLTPLGYPVRWSAWEREPKSKQSTGKGMSVPICGANYVKPKPPISSSSRQHSESLRRPEPSSNGHQPETDRHPLAPSPSPTPGVNQSTSSSDCSEPKVPMSSPDPTALERALQVTQQSLAAFQKMQEQTAQVHAQFLEHQSVAQSTLHQLVQQQHAFLAAGLETGRLPALQPANPPTPPPRTTMPPVPTAELPSSQPTAPPNGKVPNSHHLKNGRDHSSGAQSPLECDQPQPTDPEKQPSQTANGSSGTTDSSPAKADVAAILLEIVSEKTGYPTEMLELDMQLDSDLGIDSIKRVEILSALQERLPEAPIVKPEHLGTLHSLRDVAAFLGGQLGKVRRSVVEPKLPRSDQSTAKPVELTRQVLKQVPIANHRRSRLNLSGKEVTIITEEESLGTALSEWFDRESLKSRAFRWCDLPQASEILILVAPRESLGAELHRQALRWLQVSKGSLIRLVTVTRLDGAFGLGDLDAGIDPTQGGLAGLTKTVRHEWPRVNCKAIDVQPGLGSVDQAKMIAEEVFIDGPLEVGLEREGRSTLELTNEASVRPASVAQWIQADDVILVTGGARGVTFEAALAIAKHARPHLVLLGRTSLPEEEPTWLINLTDEKEIKRALATELNGDLSPRKLNSEFSRILAERELRRNLDRLKATGAPVRYVCADVTEREAVQEAVNSVQAELGGVTGVIHGAGVLADRRIEDLTVDQFDHVYRTKVTGLCHVLEAIEAPPKLVVMFSSTTARLGRAGQLAYAVANEGLNKLAQRYARFWPNSRVRAINWGPWEGGMVTPGLRDLFHREGVGLIPLDEGGEFLCAEIARPNHDIEVVALAAPPNTALPLAFERKVDLESHPILRSHVIDHHAVFPMALHLEWLAHGALHTNPGLQLIGCDDLRVFTGLKLRETEKVHIRVHAGKAKKWSNSERRIPVEMYGDRPEGEVLYSQGTVILAEQEGYQDMAIPVPEVVPADREVEEFYQGVLFHGPELQVITSIEGIGVQGAISTVRPAPSPSVWMNRPLRGTWLAEPSVLDAAFQMMIIWSHHRHRAGCLPVRLGRYRQFLRRFPRQEMKLILRVTRDDGLIVRADVDVLGPGGELLATLRETEHALDAALNKRFRRNELVPLVGVTE